MTDPIPAKSRRISWYRDPWGLLHLFCYAYLWFVVSSSPRTLYQEVISDSAPYLLPVVITLFGLQVLRRFKCSHSSLLVFVSIFALADVSRHWLVTGVTFLKGPPKANTTSDGLPVRVVFVPNLVSIDLCTRLQELSADVVATRTQIDSSMLNSCRGDFKFISPRSTKGDDQPALSIVVSPKLSVEKSFDMGEDVSGVSVFLLRGPDGGEFQVATASLYRVDTAEQFRLVKVSVRRVATLVRNSELPVVLISDLRSTLWSKWNGMFVRQARTKSIFRQGSLFIDVLRGNVFLPFVKEHFFTSRGISVASANFDQDSKGDLSIFADLKILGMETASLVTPSLGS